MALLLMSVKNQSLGAKPVVVTIMEILRIKLILYIILYIIYIIYNTPPPLPLLLLLLLLHYNKKRCMNMHDAYLRFIFHIQGITLIIHKHTYMLILMQIYIF